MAKWPMVRLGDVCTINMGQSPSSESYNDENDGIPFYQGNADFGEIHPKARLYCNKPIKIANKNDVLLSVRAPIGALNIANEKCCIGRGLCAITEKENISYYKYIYYVLKRKTTELIAKGTGSTFKAINKSSLLSVQIPLPPINIQKYIADILDKTQEIIDSYKKQLAELDNLIRAVFYEMFGDPLANDKGWTTVLLKEVLANIRYGTSTPPNFSETGYKFIRATNIKKGRIVEEDMKFISKEESLKLKKCKIYENEMIIVRSGVNSGDTCVISNEYSGHYAGYDLILTFDQNKVDPVFVNELFNTNYMEIVIKPLTRRAAQPHLNSEQVQSLRIILPPLDLQTKFATIVTKIEEQKVLVKRAITDSEQLFNSLMSEYFD
ncbi:MAG TPA: restriction endonuclease subunit S [Bacillota bacterium]